MSIFFPEATFLIGGVMSLESLRRGQAGALMLGIFITAGLVEPAQTKARLDQLAFLAYLGRQMIREIPEPLSFLQTPFYDYLTALD